MSEVSEGFDPLEFGMRSVLSEKRRRGDVKIQILVEERRSGLIRMQIRAEERRSGLIKMDLGSEEPENNLRLWRTEDGAWWREGVGGLGEGVVRCVEGVLLAGDGC